jgi:hypothetical protein
LLIAARTIGIVRCSCLIKYEKDIGKNWKEIERERERGRERGREREI